MNSSSGQFPLPVMSGAQLRVTGHFSEAFQENVVNPLAEASKRKSHAAGSHDGRHGK